MWVNRAEQPRLLRAIFDGFEVALPFVPVIEAEGRRSASASNCETMTCPSQARTSPSCFPVSVAPVLPFLPGQGRGTAHPYEPRRPTGASLHPVWSTPRENERGAPGRRTALLSWPGSQTERSANLTPRRACSVLGEARATGVSPGGTSVASIPTCGSRLRCPSRRDLANGAPVLAPHREHRPHWPQPRLRRDDDSALPGRCDELVADPRTAVWPSEDPSRYTFRPTWTVPISCAVCLR